MKVSINGEAEIDCQNVLDSETPEKSPLYIAPWKPSQMAVGVKHTMKVTAILSEGPSEITISTNRQFVLDTKAIANEGTSLRKNFLLLVFYLINYICYRNLT